eukprot:gnl/MRDRNA2_/MRDRNA2_23951_c0_seq1.p1 gnl/MRDRNA2_/MRDRNA2_23951_c0~~gnl/MRDRNA2_/MRDRNA2_23951_c0_seq1.p1  ORF type:complete len:214 (+),score=32.54 gnl/MRDRNA2_/MRDRNA2_23951_c0_seq1:49-690(+)
MYALNYTEHTIVPKLGKKKPLRVLDLGSGCGLLGIGIAASIPNAQVLVTGVDIPIKFQHQSDELPSSTLEWLHNNVQMNHELVSNRVEVAPLLWGDKSDIDAIKSSKRWATGFDLVVGSDLLYNPFSYEALLQTIKAFSGTSPVVLSWHERLAKSHDKSNERDARQKFLEDATKFYNVSQIHDLMLEKNKYRAKAGFATTKRSGYVVVFEPKA